MKQSVSNASPAPEYQDASENSDASCISIQQMENELKKHQNQMHKFSSNDGSEPGTTLNK